MTPTPPSKGGRKGIIISRVLIAATVAAFATTIAFAVVLGTDLRNTDYTPDRQTLAALIISATAWIGLFCAALNDAAERRAKRSEQTRDELIWGIADRLDNIEGKVDDFSRRAEKALIVIHDEVNRFAEGHTEELGALAQAIKEWGDEQETRGELAGLRRAVGIVPVGDKPGTPRPPTQLRSVPPPVEM